MSKNRNNITTAVSDEVMDGLDLLARKAGKTRAAYARKVFEDHVRANAKERSMKVSRGIPESAEEGAGTVQGALDFLRDLGPRS